MKKSKKRLADVCHYAYFSSEVMLPDAQQVMNKKGASSVVMLKAPQCLRHRVNKMLHDWMPELKYAVRPSVEPGLVEYYFLPSFSSPTDCVRQLKNELEANELSAACSYTWVVDILQLETKEGGYNG